MNDNMDRNLHLRRDTTFRLSWDDPPRIEIAFGEGSSRKVLSAEQPLLFAWLLALRGGASHAEAKKAASGLLGVDHEGAELLVSLLQAEGLLSTEGAGPFQDARQQWTRWGWRDALDFHMATRDLAFEPGDEAGWERQLEAMEAWSAEVARGEEEPSPGPYKSYPEAPVISLERSRRFIDARPFGEVLHARQTFRAFDRSPIELTRLSEVLEHALGETGRLDFGVLGPHLRKTAPSGGARHPIEAYLAIMSVEGVPPGLYHYSVEKHALERLRAGDFGEEVWELGHRQSGLRGVSAAVFYTVRWARHMWKYRYARSYRMVMYDTAHLVQNQILAATAVGLRTFLTPAIRDTATEAFLGIGDAFAESALYLTGMG